MSDNRLRDYLGHIRQAAADACDFVDGVSKSDFLADKRTQQAVIMSLIIIGEAATKITLPRSWMVTLPLSMSILISRGEVCVVCAIASLMAISILILMWCGRRCETLCPSFCGN